jgi:hypothetical protein
MSPPVSYRHLSRWLQLLASVSITLISAACSNNDQAPAPGTFQHKGLSKSPPKMEHLSFEDLLNGTRANSGLVDTGDQAGYRISLQKGDYTGNEVD